MKTHQITNTSPSVGTGTYLYLFLLLHINISVQDQMFLMLVNHKIASLYLRADFSTGKHHTSISPITHTVLNAADHFNADITSKRLPWDRWSLNSGVLLRLVRALPHTPSTSSFSLMRRFKECIWDLSFDCHACKHYLIIAFQYTLWFHFFFYDSKHNVLP